MACLFMLFHAMNTKAQSGRSNGGDSLTPKQKDTTVWTVNLDDLRQALYQGEKAKVRIYVNLPMPGDGHEIWGLASQENEVQWNSKPFSEKDFYKYYFRLFPKAFIQCLLSIKMNDLYRTGTSTSKEYREGSTTFVLYATYKMDDKDLKLNLASNTSHKISATEFDVSEFNIIYHFRISDAGHVKLHRVFLAG